MKKIMRSSFFLLLISLAFFSSCRPVPEIPYRYFDRAETEHEGVRLTVLYPSKGSLESIISLRKNGLLTVEKLTLIGVYHEMEMTDYEKAREFVRKKRINWIRFHQISSPLSKYTLFQKNACSDEFEMIFRKSDGIIFFGGADVPPYLYQKKTSLLTRIQTPYRHYLELSFVFHLLGGLQSPDFKALLESKPEFPVLGICLGCQSLNVGTGGTLIQDIWSEKYGLKYLEEVINLGRENWHTNPLARLYPEMKLLPYFVHPIKLKKKGKFCTQMGFSATDRPYILSAHHQMVDELGKNIRIIATSLDGKVVEAVEHQKFPNVLGVQFHPEFPILWDRTKKYRLTPQDTVEKSLYSMLEENPPSLEFHRKLWSWFNERLK
ncbi:MAG: gamma-glutamyl-gamma-aminobutyrate hydrolase family protein [Candidatus Aminicenantales bacterium]